MNSDNTTGIRGVSFITSKQKYRAQITFKGKAMSLGNFDSIEDAAKARKKLKKICSFHFWTNTKRQIKQTMMTMIFPILKLKICNNHNQSRRENPLLKLRECQKLQKIAENMLNTCKKSEYGRIYNYTLWGINLCIK